MRLSLQLDAFFSFFSIEVDFRSDNVLSWARPISRFSVLGQHDVGHEGVAAFAQVICHTCDNFSPLSSQDTNTNPQVVTLAPLQSTKALLIMLSLTIDITFIYCINIF